MPIVPSIQGPQIQEQQIQASQLSMAPPAAFNANEDVFKAAGDLQKESSDIFQIQKNNADELAALDAKKQLSDAETNILYDPDNGALLKKGKDAAEVPQLVSDKYKQSYGEIRDSLQNDAQKLAFDKYYEQNSADLNKTVQKHVGEEMHKFDNETTIAVISNERGIAVSNYEDVNRVNQSIQNQKDELARWAKRNGVAQDSPILLDKVRDAQSKTQAEVITRMLDNNQDLQASNYYKQVKDQIAGDEIGKIEKLLQVGNLKGESQRRADDIVDGSDSYAEALDQIRDIKDPKVRDATQERIKNYYESQKQASSFDREQLLQQASADMINSNGKKDTPTSVLSQLEPKQIESLANLRKQLNAGIEPPANGPTYAYLLNLANTPETRNQFANTLIENDLDKMTRAEGKQLLELRGKVREKDGATTDLLDYQNSNEKIKRDALAKAGVIPGNFEWTSPSSWFGNSDAKNFVQLNSAIDQEVKQKEKSVGRVLTADEMTDTVNRFTTKMITSPGYLGTSLGQTSKFIQSLQPEDIQLDQIPVDIRNNLANTLKQKNWPVTEKNIKDFYVKGIKAGVIKPNGGE